MSLLNCLPMDGVFTCAKYAFAPNYYKYCGPDANRTVAAYLKEGVSDPGLAQLLIEFAVLYPYLKLIARENRIADPFDLRVVEAYWIGNRLLEKVGLKSFNEHLLYEQKLKKRIPAKKLKWVMEKIPAGAKLHHSFHVFSIFARTGHHAVDHTLNTMEECRIGWGVVLDSEPKAKNQKQSTTLELKTQKLIYEKGKLKLVDGVLREVNLPFTNFEKKIRAGDSVTYHWGFICAKINKRQAQQLEFYTKHNLRLANKTI